MFALDRFKQAQDSRHAGFATALAELRAGRKTSHWIWYIFPQLASLGRSSIAVRYGIAGREEAAAYLRDPLLAERLVSATAAVSAHLTPGATTPLPARLEEIMGSEIDAQKLVSSMTLFAQVARELCVEERRPEWVALAEQGDVILHAAADQGYERCAVTQEQLGPRTG